VSKSSSLKLAAAGFLETSVYACVATRRHKQDWSNHSHRSENLKTHMLLIASSVVTSLDLLARSLNCEKGLSASSRVSVRPSAWNRIELNGIWVRALPGPDVPRP
jgi:hypothetical protein